MTDERVKDLIEVNKEAERYAGQLERAVERIALVCRLARDSEPQDLACVLDLIGSLAMVKDDRKRIAPYAPNEQG